MEIMRLWNLHLRWEYSYLVGIDSAGRFHFIAYDTSFEEFQDQLIFAVCSKEGDLVEVLADTNFRIALLPGDNFIWANDVRDLVLSRSSLFSIGGYHDDYWTLTIHELDCDKDLLRSIVANSGQTKPDA